MNRKFRIIPVIVGFLLPIGYIEGQPYNNPEIVRLLVDPETNNVHIYYTGTDHPDVTHYKISRWMFTGNNPVPSGVPIESSSTPHSGAPEYHWTDYIGEVTGTPVGFTVGAYNNEDEPINQSYPPDSTICLTAEYDSCLASLSLQWNDYNAWRGNTLEYEVHGSNSNGNYTFVSTLPGNVTSTVITGLQANNQYMFYILSRKNSSTPADTVTSNGVRFSTIHAYYPEYIHADYGTVAEGNHPFVHFTIDSLSELTRYVLFRSEDPTGEYVKRDSFYTSGDYIEYSDELADASAGPYYYILKAVNYCHEMIVGSENIAGTICLTARMAGNAVNLDWTPYYEWSAGVSQYDIERSLSDEPFELIGQTQSTEFTDNSLTDMAGQQISSEVCYRITAHENPGDVHSETLASSSSNSYCIILPMNIRFEYNAFVPGLDGFATFGPAMDFIPSYFDFKIFNRAGTKVFESKDPYSPRWDGKYENGVTVPEGVYRYQLEYKDETGKKSVLTGSVSVVRQ